MNTLVNAYGNTSGRRISITKVENGYQVDAQYTVKKIPEIGNMKEYYDTVNKHYVFSTDEDAVSFIIQYLTAPAEKLNEKIKDKKKIKKR